MTDDKKEWGEDSKVYKGKKMYVFDDEHDQPIIVFSDDEGNVVDVQEENPEPKDETSS